VRINHLMHGMLRLAFIALAACMVWFTGNEWWVFIALCALILSSSSKRD